MNVKYRVGDLELRLNDIPKEQQKLHSPYSEIVQWGNECCWTIATFEYDNDGYPELKYCGNRPLDLNKEQQNIFLTLIKEGYKYKRNKIDNKITTIEIEEFYD